METEGSLPHSQQPVTSPYLSARSTQSMPPSYFLKIQLNIIFPSPPESTNWSLPLRFPHQNPVYTPPLSHTCYTARSSQSALIDHPNSVWWGVQINKLLIIHSSPLLRYLDPLTSIYPPQHPILKHPQPTFIPQYELPSFTPIQNYMQNYNSIYLTPYIFG